MPPAAVSSHPRHKHHASGGNSSSGPGFSLPVSLTSMMTSYLPFRLSTQQASLWAARVSASGLLLLMALVVAMQAFFPSLTAAPHIRPDMAMAGTGTGAGAMPESRSAWQTASSYTDNSAVAQGDEDATAGVIQSAVSSHAHAQVRAQRSSSVGLSDAVIAANAASAGTRHLTSASPASGLEASPSASAPASLLGVVPSDSLTQTGEESHVQASEQSGRQGGEEGRSVSAPRKAGRSHPSSPSPSPPPSLSANAPLASVVSSATPGERGGGSKDAGRSGGASGDEGEVDWRAEAEALMDAAQSFHLEPHVTGE